MDSVLELERETLVLKGVARLQRAGLWTKLNEKPAPKMPKCHWDYLLEEMRWMAKIFGEERIIKEKLTKKCAKMIQTHFRTEELKSNRIAKEEELQRRRNAQLVSRMIRKFWSNAGKLVNFKVHAIRDIARRRNLDEKLNQVLNKSEELAKEISINLETQGKLDADNDDDFKPDAESESDVEDTIAQEEKLSKGTDYKAELDELEDENNLTYEQLVAKYSGYLGINSADIDDTPEDSSNLSKSKAKQGPSSSGAGSGRRGRRPRKPKVDSSLKSGEPETERYTLRSRSRSTGRMTVKSDSDLENNNKNDSDPEDETTLGIAELVKEEEANFLPSGHTLQTTKVTTKVPFLLRHELREYQHIGLEWLVTLYERKLNGILADEMGLGKTIQTIALLAYLAVEKGNWGPHLIVVPSSLMLNWELEFLRWCPSFKILTYFGSSKDRKEKRQGWSTPNAFHICITSYTLAVQDHLCFRRRPWEYMILDEAHNIKNFKSQRWQVLLNFNTQRRLLLTGTPLQNNLMELWSLLHFLMPHVFESHSEFREWFSKPISEISSGSREYNETIVKQFHKTLRPFLLRRLKAEVEKQMPKKVEHIIKCSLSKRQRHLYDEFMARSDTRKSIVSGSFLNVLNVLMQLRKVCNHPDMFEPRPVISSFRMDAVSPTYPKCVWDLNLLRINFDELMNTRFCGRKTMELKAKDALEMLYEPLLPSRHATDRNTSEPIINLIHEEREMPRASVPVLWIPYEGKFRILKYPVEDAPADTNDEEPSYDDDAGTIEMTNSQSSLSQYDSILSSSGTQDTVTSGDAESVNTHSDYDSIAEDDFYYNIDVEDYFMTDPSQMLLPKVEAKRVKDRQKSALILYQSNRRRYQTCYLLDESLVNSCTLIGAWPSMRIQWTEDVDPRNAKFKALESSVSTGFGNGDGYAQIMLLQNIRTANPRLIHHPFFKWRITEALKHLVKTVEGHLSSVHLDFVFCISPVCINTCLEAKIYTPATAALQYRSVINREQLKKQLSKRFSILHPTASRLATLFPDPRLVEYDCGKLQVLNGLLRDLKRGGHRVLLFTQMSKMLDILEAFFNYHGHIYLRMDGGTKIEQRQLLVERFNKDSKIFCFLLSTRAGGLGINLTGADTVIFYDSDWNPTIDAQAQDRCHRIGQTRDVHIYRLISENTIEENILKTSNQKRLLGEHAIEEGKFNMEFFRKDTFRQLFNLPGSDQAGTSGEKTEPLESTEVLTKDALESALAAVEDDIDDRRAAKAAKKEAEAEINEFSEEVSSDKSTLDLQRLKDQYTQLLSVVTGIERYALLSLDPSLNDWSDNFIEQFMQSVTTDEPESVAVSAASSQQSTDDEAPRNEEESENELPSELEASLSNNSESESDSTASSITSNSGCSLL